MQVVEDSARLGSLPVLCPSWAIQASGLAGGYDFGSITLSLPSCGAVTQALNKER